MEIHVPARVLETATGEFGEEGRAWLDALPTRIADLERAWSLRVASPFDTDGCCAWVAPATLADGTAAVLKISIPHDEARYEGEALRLYDGRGAARLLRATEDGFTLLLERCVPGTNLWELDPDAGDAAGAAILRQLRRDAPPAAPFETLVERAQRWAEELPVEAPPAGYDADLIEHAVRLAPELAATQTRAVLLHGDFHPGNVLAATRAGSDGSPSPTYLAIDCKPVVGEPAYDLAQWLSNRREGSEATGDPVGDLTRRLYRMSEILDLDPVRVAGWTFAKSLGWEWGPEAARLFYRVLEGVSSTARK